MAAEKAVPVEARLYIDGKFVSASDKATFDLHSPYTGDLVGKIAEATTQDVDTAVAAAARAFPSWSSLSPSSRGAPLAKLATLIHDHTSQLATLDARSIGRPTSSYFDAHYATTQLAYFAQAAYAIGATSLNTPGYMNFSLRQPYGVVAAIIPWNAPLVFLSKKLGPALAAGNTVVLKTSEKAPLSSSLVAGLLVQAGFPPGVVNVLHGHGGVSGAALARHMGVRALSFTGSVATGRKIMRAAADSNFKRVIFELGGKSPAIVFADADLRAAAKETVANICLNSGQTCMANSRVYVARECVEEFVALFRDEASRRVVGDPEQAETQMGPLADRAQWAAVRRFVELGNGLNGETTAGAATTTTTEDDRGGDENRPEKENLFVPPTIFRDVPPSHPLVTDEIFGPVVCINAFATEAEAVSAANDSEYGLYAAVYTRDLDRGLRVAKALESGMVGVNCTSPTGCWDLPFGGYKQSGVGREGFLDSLGDWLETKSVFVRVRGLEAGGEVVGNGVLGR